jgi:hypothetical protein
VQAYSHRCWGAMTAPVNFIHHSRDPKPTTPTPPQPTTHPQARGVRDGIIITLSTPYCELIHYNII